MAAVKQDGRTPLIAGNWKMNLDHLQSIAFVQKLAWSLKDANHDFGKVEVAVFPPFTDLRSVQTLVNADDLPLAFGGQDISEHDDGVAHAEAGQHRPGDLAGVGTAGVRGDVLRAVADLQLVGVDQRLHRPEVGERRYHDDLDRGVVVLGVLERPRELLQQVRRLQVVEVHLPVAREERRASGVHCHPRTSSPGSFLPSRNSRLAPPPVEI